MRFIPKALSRVATRPADASQSNDADCFPDKFDSFETRTIPDLVMETALQLKNIGTPQSTTDSQLRCGNNISSDIDSNDTSLRLPLSILSTPTPARPTTFSRAACRYNSPD